MTPTEVNQLLRKRRAVFPKSYINKPISREIIQTVLENANWAPTHRRTEPWRFKVFTGAGLEKLAQYMGSFFMQADPENRVPEWEELASVAIAVQNMWLTCEVYNIGSYWSSPRAALEGDAFLGLKEGERCLGLFYMGYHEMPEVPGKRSPIEEKVEWVEA